MEKALHDFLFGLYFGCGFAIATGVIAFVADLIAKSRKP